MDDILLYKLVLGVLYIYIYICDVCISACCVIVYNSYRSTYVQGVYGDIRLLVINFAD